MVKAGRAAAGLGFLTAAVFNLTVTRHKASQTLERMHDDAWLPPFRWLLRRILIPHAPTVIVSAAIYEAAVGACILTRGRFVTIGLVGGAAWAVVTTPVLPPDQAIGNFRARACAAIARIALYGGRYNVKKLQVSIARPTLTQPERRPGSSGVISDAIRLQGVSTSAMLPTALTLFVTGCLPMEHQAPPAVVKPAAPVPG